FDPRPRVAERRQAHERDRHLTPPLIITSEGEIPQKPVPKDLPEGALAGLGASAGVACGLARVVLDPAREVLHAGEILVAPYTDPGWTPLFVHAAGLVCDVGGMMTHGSVIAREYGIPAVVGVGDGTKRLRTGQRLRVDGSRGIVEVLEDAP
ncbi:MAG TPA: PEP-utilizing enzyme, partial [Nannocystis sp.]